MFYFAFILTLVAGFLGASWFPEFGIVAAIATMGAFIMYEIGHLKDDR